MFISGCCETKNLTGRNKELDKLMDDWNYWNSLCVQSQADWQELRTEVQVHPWPPIAQGGVCGHRVRSSRPSGWEACQACQSHLGTCSSGPCKDGKGLCTFHLWLQMNKRSEKKKQIIPSASSPCSLGNDSEAHIKSFGKSWKILI